MYALYNVPTIVCAAIFLTIRHLRITLPSESPTCWWELFDAEWEDIWTIAGYVMRLYRKRDDRDTLRVMGLTTKKDVRAWIDANGARRDEVNHDE